MKVPDAVLGFTILRLGIGMTMLLHGVTRLFHPQVFVEHVLKLFASSPLPTFSLAAFAWANPVVELLIGVLVLLGLWTSFGLVLGGLWMVVLIFGSTLIEKYDLVGIQLIYSLIFFQLLRHSALNELSIDRLLARRKASSP